MLKNMIKRTLESLIKQIDKTFPVLLLTGPRQVGKTTLLENCARKTHHYVTLDNLEERELAKTDPALFLETHKTPLIIDEVQYAPELMSMIKQIVDKEKKNGLFWLTGSQKFHLMKNITESLAGRVAIIDILGLSQAERDNRANLQDPFIPTKAWLRRAKKSNPSPKSLKKIYQEIWKGSFPKLTQTPNTPRDIYYQSYIQTYISRDVKDILNITNDLSFNKFLRAIAARTGCLLNFSDLARDIDIDHKTIKSWISVLETSGLIYLLYPLHSNVTKRLTKTPKLYFLDTGLASYLTKWPTPESLEAGAMSGAILETHIISEIIKSYWHNGKTGHLYYYRDSDQKEIDLIIESGNTLHPIEIKKTATPSKTTSNNFSSLKKLQKPIGEGAIICLIEKDIPISKAITAIPASYL